jgi:opacity protein-like surface antigen
VGDPGKVSPYVIGGGGIAHISAGDTTVSGSFMGVHLAQETIPGESENKPIAVVGAGVDIPLGERVGILVEGRYQLVFTGDERTNFASFRGGLRIGL